MSNAEHAIENAVSALEHGREFAEWADMDPNLEYLSADPGEIWEMATWVLFNLCQYCPHRPEQPDEEGSGQE